MKTPTKYLSALLFWFAATFLTISTEAHEVGTSYLRIDADQHVLVATFDLGLRDLEFALELDDGDREITWGEVNAKLPLIAGYVNDSTAISLGGRQCALEKPRLAIDSHAGEIYASVRFETDCAAAGDATTVIGVRSDLFFDIDVSHRTLLTIRNGESETVTVLTDMTRIWSSETKNGTDFLRFVSQGIWHILIGFDHLAFLALLLLPILHTAPLNLRNTAHQVVRIVTAFTIAHSITLILAALGYIDLPSKWTEATIAASIVIAAIANLFSVPARVNIALAFGFGLIHGLGFAGALAALPQEAITTRVAPLLGFNLGVELGQLAIVALALPILFLITRTHVLRHRAITTGSLAIGTLGCIWLAQRI